MQLLAVLTTVATRDEAQTLARALVERRLAACVQIEAIESVYRWDGRVQAEPEWRLMGKTVSACWPAIEAAVRECHPYALPQLVAFVLDPVSADYAAWVASECAAPAG